MGASFVLVPGTNGSVVTGLSTAPFYVGLSNGTYKLSPLSDGSIPVTLVRGSGEPTPNNQMGTQSIASGANSNTASYTTAATNYITGIQICSTQDGLWTFTLPGFATLYFVTNQMQPNYTKEFETPIPIPSGQTITMNAQNLSAAPNAATGTYAGGWYAHT